IPHFIHSMENPFLVLDATPTCVVSEAEEAASSAESPLDFPSPLSDDSFDFQSDVASPSSEVASPTSNTGAENSSPSHATVVSPDRYLHLHFKLTPTRSPRRHVRWDKVAAVWRQRTPPKPRLLRTTPLKEKAGGDDPDFEEHIGFKRTKANVEANEYRVMASVFSEIMKAPQGMTVQDWFQAFGKRPRERLGALCNVAKTVAQRAVSFADDGVLRIPRAREGRPKKQMEVLGEQITTIVAESNKLGIPNSAGYVANELRESHGVKTSTRSVSRYMKENLDMYYGKGIRQNMMHDAPVNVNYRYEYLKGRLDNLEMVDGKLVPKLPEVFLDESYCHLDHSASRRWVQKGGIVTEPGRGPLLVIFAAFVVYYDRENHRMESKFVQDSVYIWPAIGKAHIHKKTGDNGD
ncbi:hypothetical protein BGZ99_003207, partial [Dissophora globulifera]